MLLGKAVQGCHGKVHLCRIGHFPRVLFFPMQMSTCVSSPQVLESSQFLLPPLVLSIKPLLSFSLISPVYVTPSLLLPYTPSPLDSCTLVTPSLPQLDTQVPPPPVTLAAPLPLSAVVALLPSSLSLLCPQ